MQEKLKQVLLILISLFVLTATIFLIFGIKKINEPKNNTVKYMSWCRSEIMKYNHRKPEYMQKDMIECVKAYRIIENKAKK